MCTPLQRQVHFGKQTAPNKNPEPLNKKCGGQNKTPKQAPQNGSLFTGVLHITTILDPKVCQNVRKPCVLRGFCKPHLSRRRLSTQFSVVIRGLVLHWPPARNRKTRQTTGLKVVVSLLCLLGPRGSPQRMPGEGQEPPRERKTRRTT